MVALIVRRGGSFEDAINALRKYAAYYVGLLVGGAFLAGIAYGLYEAALYYANGLP